MSKPLVFLTVFLTNVQKTCRAIRQLCKSIGVMHKHEETNDFIIVLIAHKTRLSDSKNWISFPHNPEVVGSSPSPATIPSVFTVFKKVL